MTNSNNKTILIADPGVDDIIAILAAPNINSNLEFIATYGNGPTNITHSNYQGIIEFIAKNNNTPPASRIVYFGADRPLNASSPHIGEDLEFIHGKNLSEGLFSKKNTQILPSSKLYDSLLEQKCQLDIISLGAVTEIAHILERQDLTPQINSITLMGGAISAQGNVAPRIEANLAHDPKSLQIVLQKINENKIPLTLIPLDLTESPTLEFTEKKLKKITTALGPTSQISKLLYSLIGPNKTYPNFYCNKKGVYYHLPPYIEHLFKSCPIHDLTALLVHFHPELFNIIKRPLLVSELGELGIPTAWMDKGVECNIALEITNSEEYWKLTTDYLKTYK